MSALDRNELSDPQLSALYRQHVSAEPSAAVDQRILQTARAVLVEGGSICPRPVGWRRWRTVLALTATLLLSVALTLLHERPPGSEPSQPEDLRRARELPADRAEGPTAPAGPPSVAASAPVVPSRPVEPKSVAGRALGKAEPALANARGQSGRNSIDPSPAPAERLSTMEQHSVAEASVAPTESAAPSKAESVVAPRFSGRGVAPAPVGDESSRVDAAPGGAGRPGSRPFVRGVREPAVWIEEILTLRREGKGDAAERQLREFRRTYPDYPLPDAVRP